MEAEELAAVGQREGLADMKLVLAASGETMIRKLQALLPYSLRRLGDGEELRARAARGAVWLSVSAGAEQSLRFLRNMVLTRLLAPEAFGAMAIVLAINTLLESFTDVGTDTSIIQSPRGEEPAYLNAAWWLSVARASGIYALGFFGAPWLAGFYSNPELVPLMRVALLGTLLNGAISPRAYVAQKRMDFKRWVAINQGGAICGIAITIFLAFAMRNMWALVIGFTSEMGARCILSYLVCPYRPRLVFDRESSHALFKYTRGMFGLPILTFAFMQADIFVIGKICSAKELGIYSMAMGLAQMPFNLVGRLVAQIANPAFSEIRGDPARTKNMLLKATSVIALLAFPLALFIALYGRDLLLVAYGRPYAAGAIPLAILFYSAVLKMISVPVISLYFMLGRPGLHRLFAGIRTLLMILMIYPAVKWYGLTGAATAGLLSMLVGFAFQVARLRGFIELDLRQYSRVFVRASGFSLVVAAVWVATYRALSFGPLTKVAVGALGCLLGYALAYFLRPRSSTVFQW